MALGRKRRKEPIARRRWLGRLVRRRPEALGAPGMLLWARGRLGRRLRAVRAAGIRGEGLCAHGEQRLVNNDDYSNL